ncbi:MAG: protein-L-isoaspartate O-methyltransferase [Pseudomonadota bacterium]
MNTELARQQMVYQQVRAWDVFAPDVLDTLASVARERFVPEAWRDAAFADINIPLGSGQRMFTPKLEGRILQALDIAATDSVLEIGCGSGFLTACLAMLGGRVHALDRLDAMVAMTEANLAANEIDGVQVEALDVTLGLPQQQYDVIVVGGSVATSLKPFEAQLKTGGRLFAVTGEGATAVAMRVRKFSDERWEREALFETALPPLHDFAMPATLDF